MKIKSTKWFKDFTSYTKDWSIIKGIAGGLTTLLGLKWLRDATVLHTLNWTVTNMNDDEVEDNFDELNKFE